MKKIFLHSRDIHDNSIFRSSGRDNMNHPFIALRTALQARGYDLATLDSNPVEEAEWVLFFDAFSVLPPGPADMLIECIQRRHMPERRRDVYHECVAAGMGDKLVLFLWEGPAVVPRNGDPRLHSRFPIIFTWNDTLVDNHRYLKLYYPQPNSFPATADIPYRDRKLLTCISGNKYSHSPKELYSERRKAIRYFESARPDDFDLYGLGWSTGASWTARIHSLMEGRFPSYRGSVIHKWDVYPQYRFAICYENIQDEVGYVTEKIFDCMRAGCVPIYWGAPNIGDFVPAETFIDRRAFASNRELESYLLSVTGDEYQGFQNAIQRFLQSERFQLFSEAHFADSIIQALL